MTQNNRDGVYSRNGILALSSAILWFLSCYFGEGLGGSWGSNLDCSKYFGCTSGFFGYDAIEHFLFGITATWALVWVFKKFPKYSLLQDKFWKNIIIIVALVSLLSVVWELMECLHDAFRLDILHQMLRSVRLHINLLDQPTNLDTMGDLTFSLCGSMLSLLFAKK